MLYFSDMETDYNSLGDSIKKLLALTEENNKMLKAMRREKWIGMLINFVFWAVILYVSYALTMQLVEPLMGQFTGTGASGGVDIQKLLQQYQAQMGK
jgi:hypothetical protein